MTIVKFGGRAKANWMERLDRVTGGACKATAHNVHLILLNDPELKARIWRNEFSGTAVKVGALPWGAFDHAPVVDGDGFELAAYLGQPETYGMPAKSALCHEGIQAAADRFTFHPVRAYLERLAWDGTPRMRQLFGEWCGEPESEYRTRCATIVVVSAVARVFDPGCKVDTMAVLEGPQGAGKTRFTRELFGADWYAEATEPPGSKDFYQCLPGRWCLEIGEMESFSKAEVGRIKLAVTTPSDWYRPSYGRVARAHPRQCIFVGTTNDTQYLRDPTGGRRFLPVTVGPRVQVDAVIANRDQVWAEAVHLYRQGFRWWDLPTEAGAEQEARYLQDGWEGVFARFLDALPQKEREAPGIVRAGDGSVEAFFLPDLLVEAVGLDYSRQHKAEQMRAAQALRRLGWHKAEGQRGAGRRRMWVRDDRSIGGEVGSPHHG